MRRVQNSLYVMGSGEGCKPALMAEETALDQIDGSMLAIKPSGFVTPVALEE